MMRKSSHDLNSLITLGNIAVCVTSIYLYCTIGGNQYIDIFTLILLCVFCAVNLLILLYERRKRDPFVLLLLINTLFFYMGRVVTLLYVPSSLWSFDSADLNYSLIFVIFSNVFIFLGLSAAGMKISFKEEAAADRYPANPAHIAIILLFSIGISFGPPFFSDSIARGVGYLSLFLKFHVIIFFTIIYLLLNFYKILIGWRVILLGVVAIFVLMTTLAGSRSALLVLFFLSLMAVLSVKGRVMVNNKIILIGIALVPVALSFFIIATIIGQTSAKPRVVTLEQLSSLKEWGLFESGDPRQLCRPIFERTGFLDFSTLLISKRQQYSEVINFPYYFKSIIDNVLSPGFDIFSTPMVAHSMGYITRGEPVPSYELITGAYQSDMPTIYGEYYVLFYGYFALMVFFIASFLFKKVYLWVRVRDDFLFYMYRALILYVFYLWLNSFGSDWLLLDLVSIGLTAMLFKNFFKMRVRNA